MLVLSDYYSLYISEEIKDTDYVRKRSFMGSPHYSSSGPSSAQNCSNYSNPFREYDIASFPPDLQMELERFPITKQIAILRDPYLQMKYFPQFCGN